MAALILLLLFHPIHSSTLTLKDGARPGSVAVELRAFVDDFPPGAIPAAIEAYLARQVAIADRSGVPIRLRYLRHRLEAAALIVDFEGDAPRGLAGGTVSDRLVQEKFADQVNLVRVAATGRSGLLVFLPTDRSKPIP